MSGFLRKAWVCFLLIDLFPSTSVLHGADQIFAKLLVKDALTVLREPVAIEALLVQSGLLSETGLGGEPLELMIDGKVVATSMTGGDGKAMLLYTPKSSGVIPVEVRVGTTPRVAPAKGQANVAIWERRNPILMIEMAALVDQSNPANPLPGLGITPELEQKPLPDASEELEKLTKFYYKVIYVVPSSSVGAHGFQASAVAREWLYRHRFPPGYIVSIPAGENVLGNKIDALHGAGWKTIRTGIGRTKAFAEAFLQRRLDVIIVPEPAKGEAPRKAKIVKSWKDVRKKL